MSTQTTRQNGISLISLMIGLAISMIVILGMLAVYKTTIKVTATAGRGATTDGQRLSALFASQTLLQEAGFGINGAALGSDLLVLTGAALGADNKLTGASAGTAAPLAGNAIVWGTKAGADYKCNGLYAPAAGGLVRLPAVTCAQASSWASVVWTPVVVVTDTRVVAITLSPAAARGGCKSFGIAGAGKLWVKLATKNSTELDAAASTCLTNFSAS